MKPIIGVLARPDTLLSSNQAYIVSREINEAVVKNGGIVISIIPPILENLTNKSIENTNKLTQEQFNEIKRIVDLSDGIICQGGSEFYDYDLKVIDYCYKIDKPLLGICLGMQSISCAFNGEMRDFGNLSHKSKEKYVHKVKIDKNSKLYSILKKEEIGVNSRHKSYILNTELSVVGLSDNIIEAVEDKNKKFFIGVQWQPESMIEYDITENNLFSYFINCCRR